MEHSEYGQQKSHSKKQSNTLPINGNEASMNLNPLILTNIQSSSYFKVTLFKLKTYHEVIDEIYYQVKHLEPWERGSRKTSGQTGMCGGVRGVGAGGIVSTCFCLLYKLYTLRLTRKQVNGLMSHADSPYIRALGFMYVRYTQPPGDLFDWYEDYLQDEEEIDVKAGAGQMMTIGQMLYQWLTKLEWFSTLFPRIPVPIQKQIETKINNYCREHNMSFANQNTSHNAAQNESDKRSHDRRERSLHERKHHGGRERSKERQYNRSDERHDARRAYRSRSKDRERERDRDRRRDYKHSKHSSSTSRDYESRRRSRSIDRETYERTRLFMRKK
ncbi:pre-mRNA-splicing factor 38B-like isoform X2 [Sitodiplosis mosellana]|uniref:pre-mRNA-splicing factor 38B-like isoform X2 n=1 Tax=Sitodiplosis mosellana TaxID=263140 RepID=UPI0024448F09|nr:pre-mRNA-splicing factor 38B-like isoform X2 [Sitodiplosis mosellana]